MNTLFRKLFAAAVLLGLSALAPAADYPKVIQNNAISRGMKVEKTLEKFGQNYDPPAGLDAGARPDIEAKIRSNLELMQKFGITGTPGVIWKDKNGKVFVKSGPPRLSELPAMTGLPEQKVDDPESARFR